MRDGLKPVQRRILFSMSRWACAPTAPTASAPAWWATRWASYHPHGDGAIYDALVRMGQDFSRQVTLVDPHGNFGTLDDAPAAYRYTECRLTEAAMELLAEIDEDTVEFRPTFDGERDEPLYLPARLPNLLVNGTSGIAVGMATNMPQPQPGRGVRGHQAGDDQAPPQADGGRADGACCPAPTSPPAARSSTTGSPTPTPPGRGSFRIRAKADIEIGQGHQGAARASSSPSCPTWSAPSG